MSKGQALGYLRVDALRFLKGKNVIFSVLGVVLVLFFSLENIRMAFESGSVLGVFTSATYKMGFIITFIFCAYAYGTSISEDLENTYLRYMMIRGNLKKYVFSKIFTIVATSVLVMMVGCLLFALILRIWLPWFEPLYGYDKENLAFSMFAYFIEKDRILLWVLATGFLYGICAGILTLIASYSALFISNKLLILALPALVYQLSADLFTGAFRQFQFLNFESVFHPQKNIFGNAMYSFLWALFYGFLLIYIMGIAIYKKIGRQL